MKIVFIAREFSGLTKNGGIGTAVRFACEYLAMRGGHTVHVYYTGRPSLRTFACKKAMRKLGITLSTVPLFLYFFRGYTERPRHIYKMLCAAEYDVCIFHEFMADGFFCFQAKKNQKDFGRTQLGIVTHGSSQWVDEGNRRMEVEAKRHTLYNMEKACCEWADFLISPSQYLLDWMCHRHWELPALCHCIPNFISSPESTAPRIERKHLACDSIHEIVFFGRLEERKGVRIFCDALTMMDRCLLRGMHITFLGKEDHFDSATIRKWLEPIVKHASITLKFYTKYSSPDARAYLCKEGLMAVMPSLRENSPCVVSECLESCIPFITSSEGGGKELIAEEDRGYALFYPEKGALAAKLTAILQHEGVMVPRPSVGREKTFEDWQYLLHSFTNNPAVERQEAAKINTHSCKEGNAVNYKPVLNRLVDKLTKTYVNEEDRVLLNLVFAEKPTQKLLDESMEVCDIESLGAGKCILLSYLMLENPHLQLSDYAGPRIKGLITYFRFANMKTLAHFSKIGKALNQANIPMLLFKGGAMKVLRPVLSRPMGDVDILIPEERIAEAVQICEGLGYLHYKEESNHAVDFHTETESAVDVHYSIFDPGVDLRDLHQNLFARAKPEHAFGVDFLLPCHEDLCFLVMTNFTKNLREHTSLGGLYYALCDSHFLQKNKQDFDWNIVREDAIDSDKELEVRFAAEFMNSIVPGLLPDIVRHLPAKPAMGAFCNQVIFDEDFFLKRQRECQAIRVVDLKNSPLQYGKRIAKFLVMKKLRHVPAFVHWYLNTRHAL